MSNSVHLTKEYDVVEGGIHMRYFPMMYQFTREQEGRRDVTIVSVNQLKNVTGNPIRTTVSGFILFPWYPPDTSRKVTSRSVEVSTRELLRTKTLYDRVFLHGPRLLNQFLTTMAV